VLPSATASSRPVLPAFATEIRSSLLAAPVADAEGEGTGVPWVHGVQRVHQG